MYVCMYCALQVWISFAMFESELPDRNGNRFYLNVYDTYFHITVPILNGTAAAGSDEDPSHENDNDEDEGVSDSAVEASRTVFSRGCGNDNTYIKQKTILCCAYYFAAEPRQKDTKKDTNCHFQCVLT